MILAHHKDRTLQLLSCALSIISYQLPKKALVRIEIVLNCLSILCHVHLHMILWAWSLAIWGVSALFVYSIMLAFHIDAPVTAAVLLLCATNLGMAVPSSPGYVGVYHYLVVTSLSLFGVERELALSYAFVLHLLAFLPVSLLGAFYVAKGNWTLTDRCIA
jgi:uncharacterized membrane protein YbhN (UPF0104 family)